jgi:hypothetical protein
LLLLFYLAMPDNMPVTLSQRDINDYEYQDGAKTSSPQFFGAVASDQRS